jgi:hypothetical protein
VAELLTAAAAGVIAAATLAHPPPAGTVALVNGSPVLERDLAVRLRPAPPRVGSAPFVHPRRRALDHAIRDRLFAEEARRRGLDPGGPSSQREARLYYDDHPEHFGRLRSAQVYAIAVEDAALAERLLREGEGAGDRDFAAAAGRHSLHAESREREGLLGIMDGGGQGIDDEALRPVVFQLKRRGSVGLARGSDGRHYVLRAGEVQRVVRPWTTEAAARARNLIATERRQRALDELEARLRRSARVEVIEPGLR